jgi:hypothetical protein
MKYKVVAYLDTSSSVMNSRYNKIRYKLKKLNWLGFWWTISDNDSEEVLQKQADELNLLKNR